MAVDADRPVERSRRVSGSLLTLLTLVFAVVVPTASIAGLTPQVMRTGSVSHWPWEEYGVLGWWLVPASLWLAVGCAWARPRRGTTRLLIVLAVAATLSLIYNP